jgi:hypothetical protein
MPNWCENILVVEGPEAEIAAFKEKAAAVPAEDAAVDAAEVLKLENFIPVPAAIAEAPCCSGEDHWEMENWGCNLGAINSAITTESENCLHYIFETPWTPPLAFLERVSRDWPRLRLVLAYNEPGCGFQGIAKATAGVLEDQCINI